MTAEVVAKKSKKEKKVKVTEEVVEAVEVAEVKKEKKSKKRAMEDEETAAESVVEETPKKKKSKKNKEAVEEEAVEETAAEEPKKEKKKKKKAAEEEAAEEEEPKAKKAKVEEAAEEETKEEAKEEEKKEEAEESTEEPVSTTVFIGGFPYETTEETLKKDFEECGEIINFRFPMDWATQKPKGIAFATYKDKEAVKKALAFNETDYGGRFLRVREAEDAPPGGKGDGKGKGKKGDGKKGGKGPREPIEKPEGCMGLMLIGLNYETTEDSLWALFKDQENDIAKLNLCKDRDTGYSKGLAFVDFNTTEAADAAMAAKQGVEVDGRNVFVNWKAPREEGKDGKGKGKGKDGKGKGFGKKGDGKKGKGKKGKDKDGDGARAKTSGSIQEFAGKAAKFDSDSD